MEKPQCRDNYSFHFQGSFLYTSNNIYLHPPNDNSIQHKDAALQALTDARPRTQENTKTLFGMDVIILQNIFLHPAPHLLACGT